MKNLITSEQLTELGLTTSQASLLSQQINYYLDNFIREDAWQKISKSLLNQLPFKIQLFIFQTLFPHWSDDPESAPAWLPEKDFIGTTNIVRTMAKLRIHSFREFHAWSVNHYEKFWNLVVKQLQIRFKREPQRICDLSDSIESPIWFPDSKLNIVDSCFTAPADKTAIIYQKDNTLHTLSYGELNQLSNQVANGLINQNFKSGDAIAIAMPMTPLAVAIYLGIIKMGGVVVSIADSFSSEEIATRLRITDAKAIFTQDVIPRGDKHLPLYDKVKTIIPATRAIIIITQPNLITLRPEDLTWDTFLSSDTAFDSVGRDPMSRCNILFSSGTTAEPKAICWNHTTPIKVGSDAFFHQNIQGDDILAWPTNLGWMMGPWLIFAALLNQATIALYDGLPRDRGFGEFVQNAKVTMLGVVPTLVATWRESQCMEGLDWNAIRAFSSTGECSNPEDMFYLMSLANYKPVIEYCGGTEIGGAYISSTLVEKNYPSLFTTPTLGSNFVLLDAKGKQSIVGEVALIPPSIGLSTELLNSNHHRIYFKNMPTTPDGKPLRRHGDQLVTLAGGNFSVLGRADDTMNLSGIKISSAEIERAVACTENILETAAIATLGPGPSRLIIFAAVKKELDKNTVKQIFQEKINKHLNPLFRVEDVVLVKELPKTASNKIMRRTLREQYKNTG